MEKLNNKKVEKFKRVMSELKPEIAIILSHLDPDSIACAKVFAEICKHLEKNPTIFYAGGIHLPQNQAIWNKFALGNDFNTIDQFDGKQDDYSVVLLDSSDIDDRRLNGIKIEPIIIMDHHVSSEGAIKAPKNKWYQIEDVGAAITLVVQLFYSLELTFKPGCDLSTLSVMGIIADTDIKLISHTTKDQDREVFTYLMKFADDSKIINTLNSIKDMNYLELFKKATNNMEKRESTIITDVGFVGIDDIVYTSLLADELCSFQGVNTVIVWGIADNDIYIKIRTSDDTISLDTWIKARFGKDNGGGRHGKGAAKISIQEFFRSTKPEIKKILIGLTREMVKDLSFKSTTE